ncbi:MAG TPA: PIN domain-containing protein [Thermoanaerobaculia bacterium]|nr:PIN domain-containing protein [Thermoanaerobaculia bacterium]
MTGSVFVDTNVLVYRHDATEPQKQQRAQEWIDRLWREERGRLSTQVLQELYVTLTRKLVPGLEPEAARDVARPYFAWRPLAMTPDVLEDAWQVENAHGLSWWDSLIVAAAAGAGCEWLLTEDLADDSVLAGVRVVSPFRVKPEELVSE